MATQVAAAANLAASIAAMVATAKATRMKIGEAKKDYASQIENLEQMKMAREEVMGNEYARAKAVGVESLTEGGKAGGYETRMALMKAEQSVSSGEAALGSSGLRATGTALAAKQQETDIAFAGAERVAESVASQMKVGGMQLGGQLSGIQEKKSLLTLEYGQTIAEQKRKLKELKANEDKMVLWAGLGGLAGVGSSFYTAAQGWKPATGMV